MKLDLKMTENSRPYDRTDLSSQPYNPVPRSSGRNVLNLLAQREICPRSRSAPKKQWREASESRTDFCSRPKCQAGVRDARCSLISWVEEKSLRNLSAKYCPLVPPPRSTIAAAFSPDGKTLASTHGDHTVKIIDCQSGNCMKVLTGHRRTPWVVRFHPLHPEILASGSLDQDVRLWNANTSECIECRDFYRPIASIAFHAEGDLLAVASGHKLFIWQYNKGPEASSPIMVLKTRRSLRAVHFHPHGAPYLMTAEVNDLDTSSPSMTRATSLGYLHYPSPAVFVANIHSRDYLLSLAAAQPMTSLPFLLPPATSDDSRIHLQHRSGNIASTSMQVESSARMQYQMDGNATEQYDFMVFPVDASAIPAGSYSMSEETESSHRNDRSSSAYNTVIDVVNTNEMHPVTWSQPRSSSSFDSSSGPSNASHGAFGHTPNNPELVDLGQLHEVNPQGDPLRFDYPPIQGWGMGQGQAVPSFVTNAMPVAVNLSGVPGGSSLSNQVSDSHVSGHEYEDRPVYINIPHDGRGPQPFISRIQSELTQSFAAAAAELPCTVKLRIWSHDVKNPCLLLNSERLRLTIQHAVLCSEMGAHFSPCGRYLAACVACVLPNMECDPGLQTLPNRDAGAATSPTRHPIPTHHVMYELRIYSLEEATFGSVLVSRAIRAAHCLTSIQFSPTSEHVLLAYGRRHGSLLKFIIIDGETFLPIYTVLEVYRASDLELVRVYPSSEDEVNVACFHPYAGGGLVYGTKEGKLRILQYEKDQEMNAISPNNSLYGHMPELQTYALEG